MFYKRKAEQYLIDLHTLINGNSKGKKTNGMLELPLLGPKEKFQRNMISSNIHLFWLT